MLEGLRTAAAGMIAQQDKLDAVSNDLANVNTNGYKSLRVGFSDLMYQQAGRPSAKGVDLGTGARAVQTGRLFEQGPIKQTDQPLDVAIQGEGYLQVRRADNGQLALTRDGSLNVDANGQLVTAHGDQIQPPVRLPRGVDPSSVHIGPDGSVTAGGRKVGQIQVVTVPAPSGLQAAGDSFYTVTAASGAVRRTTTATTTLQQGALEGSNVDLSDSMVDMMDAQRSYSMASKAIHMQDQMMEIANGVKQ
jgi:flagellar basal-body rod protein FlgG